MLVTNALGLGNEVHDIASALCACDSASVLGHDLVFYLVVALKHNMVVLYELHDLVAAEELCNRLAVLPFTIRKRIHHHGHDAVGVDERLLERMPSW